MDRSKDALVVAFFFNVDLITKVKHNLTEMVRCVDEYNRKYGK